MACTHNRLDQSYMQYTIFMIFIGAHISVYFSVSYFCSFSRDKIQSLHKPINSQANENDKKKSEFSCVRSTVLHRALRSLLFQLFRFLFSCALLNSYATESAEIKSENEQQFSWCAVHFSMRAHIKQSIINDTSART